MAEKDLKNYRRSELIALLYASEKKNADLIIELEQEKMEKQKLQEALEQRKMEMEETGNLADAVLKVNGICEAAQQAAQDYLDNIKERFENQEKQWAEREAQHVAQENERIRNVTMQCDALQKQTEQNCWNMEEETKQKCDAIKRQARKEVEDYWAELSGRMEEFYAAHHGIKELMNFYKINLPKVGETH